jgi:prepilin-type N-terminal cleavage/methylation domain-containing protein
MDRVDGRQPAGRAPRTRRCRGRFTVRREDGLTLVELMIVVAIIAIIAAITITLYNDIVRKSKLAADYGTVAALRSAVAIYYGRTNGSFPPGLPEVLTLVTPTPAFQCSVTPSYSPANGKLEFTATLSDCP